MTSLINSLTTDIRNHCADTELRNYLAVNVTFGLVKFDLEKNGVPPSMLPFEGQNNHDSREGSLGLKRSVYQLIETATDPTTYPH